jgi:hypothetical protein
MQAAQSYAATQIPAQFEKTGVLKRGEKRNDANPQTVGCLLGLTAVCTENQILQ